MREFIEIIVVSKENELLASLEAHKTLLQQNIGAKTFELSSTFPDKAKNWQIKGELTVENTKFEFRFQKV